MDNDWKRLTHWINEDDRLFFRDYDGESLDVKNHSYMWTAYDGEQVPLNYIHIDYRGEGPVSMNYDEARKFVKEFSELLDRAEQNMIE